MSQILVSYSTILRASGAAAAQALVQCLHSQWFHWRRGGGGPEPARKRGGFGVLQAGPPKKDDGAYLRTGFSGCNHQPTNFILYTVLVSSISRHFFVAPWPPPLGPPPGAVASVLQRPLARRAADRVGLAAAVPVPRSAGGWLRLGRPVGEMCIRNGIEKRRWMTWEYLGYIMVYRHVPFVTCIRWIKTPYAGYTGIKSNVIPLRAAFSEAYLSHFAPGEPGRVAPRCALRTSCWTWLRGWWTPWPFKTSWWRSIFPRSWRRPWCMAQCSCAPSPFRTVKKPC